MVEAAHDSCLCWKYSPEFKSHIYLWLCDRIKLSGPQFICLFCRLLGIMNYTWCWQTEQFFRNYNFFSKLTSLAPENLSLKIVHLLRFPKNLFSPRTIGSDKLNIWPKYHRKTLTYRYYLQTYNIYNILLRDWLEVSSRGYFSKSVMIF